jgi:hypothetical protein
MYGALPLVKIFGPGYTDCVMIRSSRKNLFYLITTAYLALAVMGTFSLAAAEPFRSLITGMENSPLESAFASPDDYLVQHPAEEPVIATKTRSGVSSPLRLSFQRVTSPLLSSNRENPFSKSSYAIYKKLHHADLKSTILLKLRI